MVALRSRHAAASTVNRPVTAVRAFSEYLMMTGARPDNPVPMLLLHPKGPTTSAT